MKFCVDFDVVHLADNFDLEIHTVASYLNCLSSNDNCGCHLEPVYLYGFLSEQKVPYTDFRWLRANCRAQTQKFGQFSRL